MSSWVVVGISGVTCGGKSTLAQQLQSHLPCHTKVISQDDYFFPKDSPHHVPCPGGLAHHNWDIISALDMKTMVHDVTEIVNSHAKQSSDEGDVTPSWNGTCDAQTDLSPVLLIDGFILYDHPEITKLCDLRYFFTLSRKDCLGRRVTRVYDPPDPPGYFEACVWPMYEQHFARVYDPPDPPGYFEACVWPMYEQHFARVKEEMPEVVFLDGLKDNFPHILQQVTEAACLKGKGKRYTGAVLG